MSGWGDELDEELKKDVEIKVGFRVNVRSISNVISRISEETREWDAKHPKLDLLKIWGNIMVLFLVLFTFSYSILIILTGFLYFFYGYLLIQLFGAWRRFRYSGVLYWIMTIAALVVLFALAAGLRSWIFR
ncbi:MAG: hypothetical protein IJY09_04325 [Lachnospiraceae bacterium]|nr:hypothetical protein [Lachnospiraceae bacterium]